MAARKRIYGSFIAAFLCIHLTCSLSSFGPSDSERITGGLAPQLLFKRASSKTNIPAQVKTVEIVINGADFDTTARFPYSAHQGQISGIPVGRITAYINGLDISGDTIYTGDTTVNIERDVITQPSITLASTRPIVFIVLSPEHNDTVGTRSITISGYIEAADGLLIFRMDDNDVAVEAGQWSKNVTLADGPNTYTFFSIDRLGHIRNDTLTVFYSAAAIDAQGPVLTVIQPANLSTVGAKDITVLGTVSDVSGVQYVTVNGNTASLSGGSWSYSMALNEGGNTIVVAAADNSSNSNVSRDTLMVTYDAQAVDSTAPYLSIDFPDDGDTVSSSSIVVSGTSSDISGISAVTVNGANATLSGSNWSRTVTLALGANTITAVATDNAPASNSATEALTIVYDPNAADTDPPNVAITSPANNTVVSNPSGIVIQGTASDASGVGAVIVNGDTADYSQGSWTASIDIGSQGDNTVTAVAFDLKGNHDSTSIIIKYDSTAADNTPPSITLESHASPDTVSSQTVTIRVTATDPNGIASVTINDGAASLSSGKYVRDVALVQGQNTIAVVALDNSSNANEVSRDYTLVYDPSAADNTPPVITLKSHTPGQTVSTASALIQATVTDANGVYSVLISGSSASLNTGNGYYEKSVALSSGSNTIKIVATDNSSNRNTDSLSFTLTYTAVITVTDYDGNVYPTVALGSQVWTTVNLRVTHYTDGTEIPLVTDGTAWSNLTTPGYCFYNNTTTATEKEKWGALYNWYVVDPNNPKQIAPSGWRIPTDADWTTLENWLIANGYNYDATTSGDKTAKSMADTTDWSSSTTTGAIGNNLSANNSSGFFALPGGYRNAYGNFYSQSNSGYWWSFTEYDSTFAWYRILYYDYAGLNRNYYNKRYGFSVRLVRDL